MLLLLLLLLLLNSPLPASLLLQVLRKSDVLMEFDGVVITLLLWFC
jgi:hypothetical protein